MRERINEEKCKAALESFEEYCKNNNFSFTFERYEDFHHDVHPDFPSARTITRRLGGTWNEARQILNNSPEILPADFRRHWTNNECLLSLQTFLEYASPLGASPVRDNYSRWREKQGKEKFPSAATIAYSIGEGVWEKALKVALNTKKSDDELAQTSHDPKD